MHYGNTAQFTADALSVASLADFPATVTKMLANTQSIRCAFCLTCQKICRRDSILRIVRCCHRKYIKGTIQFVVPKIVGRDTVNQKYLKEKYTYLVASLLWQIYLPVQLPRPMVRFTSSVALQSTILGNICLLDPARLCRRAY